MKTFRHSRTSRPRRLPALWCVFAWAFLAIQGVVGAAPQCDTASSMESSMPDMTDHSATQPHAHTSADCQHCHSHTQGHGCAGLHSCNAQFAAVTVPSVALSFSPMPLALLPAALTSISTLAFDPPLRPPPA